MSLIDELRGQHAQAIADILEQAIQHWSTVEIQMRAVAANGGRYVTLRPPDRTPASRALCAAVAEKAKAEGFKVTRIASENDPVAAAISGAQDTVVWRVSW